MKSTHYKKKIVRPLLIIAEFIRLESTAGIFLFFAAVCAIVIANSPWQQNYTDWFHMPHVWQFLHWRLEVPSIFWVNEALMSIFFLLVALEIKREIYLGELNSLAKVRLPAIAALGGMLVPALVYFAFCCHDEYSLRGWAIPTATDIAFALGVMSLLGSRVPVGVKLFLMALAIFDDIGAIIIIAIFYQTQIHWLALMGAAGCMLVLWSFNKARVWKLYPYLAVGFLLWFCLLHSGVHPTLAGVLLGFAIPLPQNNALAAKAPAQRLEHRLHPWVAYGVLPLFSFANAGISFGGQASATLMAPVSLAIIAGLLLGKQLGVFAATWIAVRCGWGKMPHGANWGTLYGMSLICGIGFTMSLFIGGLAFEDTVNPNYAVWVRIGVFVGSCLSGILGYMVLRLQKNKAVVRSVGQI